MNQDQLLDLQDLTKRFGRLTAVDAMTFAVERGEVLGFLGPNGSGKTTTMRMVTGFLPPTAGSAAGLRTTMSWPARRSRPSDGSATCPRARRSTAT